MIQQINVKGTYLNGYLKERVYMHQPEGFSNGTNRICLLVKTLYRLKQSKCEWNIEFDKKICLKGFTCLHVDPCAYIKKHKNTVAIITE
jgi:reverse transcriptase-like protein